MEKLLLFAGTTEGRELAEFLDRQGVSCHVCAATEYGGQLLDEGTCGHKIHSGRLDEAGMEALMRQEEIRMAVDATHPYAAQVSRQIRALCGILQYTGSLSENRMPVSASSAGRRGGG